MRVAAVVLLAFGLAALTYWRLERAGRRGWIPFACRGIAWSALGLLLLNVSCPAPGAARRPLVLLDASLSMGAPGGRWREARDSALRLGEVRRFGDERAGADTAPVGGRSLLAPALLAAAASDRPVIVMTDGEVEDADQLPADILARTGVRLFPRQVRPDVAVTRVSGPARVTAGDSVALEVEVQAVGEAAPGGVASGVPGRGTPDRTAPRSSAPGGGTAGRATPGSGLPNRAAPDSVTVEVLAGDTRLATRTVRLRGDAGGRARIAVPSARLGAGDHVLKVVLAGSSDAEPRTDARLHLVTVAPTPGVVLLAGPADWDSRFFYRTLRDVAQLPVRGYVRLEADRWRSMADLSVVPTDQVRQAARRADLLVLKGGVAPFAEGTTARGILRWPSGEGGTTQLPGDWYLSANDASPLAGAFLGQPLDSFPPALQLTPAQPQANDWVALSAQLGRRGPPRPAVIGREAGRVRQVTVLADGLWRWAFRGGSSEQAYRAWVAATASWLLAGADSARGVAAPVRRVVSNGRPVVFEWIGPGPARPTAVTLSARSGARNDTLRFDGGGRAAVWLDPGEYRYRLAGGGTGTVAVEEYSDELLPHAITLTARPPSAVRSASRTAARDWLWLFGICVVALSGEWFARRRLGLR